MLWVHQSDLARRHPEKRCVESRYVIDEACPAGHHLAGRTGIRIEEFLDIPTVLGHLRYRIPALPQHLPELVRIRGAREARRVTDDRKTRCPAIRPSADAMRLSSPASAGEIRSPGGAPVARQDRLRRRRPLSRNGSGRLQPVVAGIGPLYTSGVCQPALDTRRPHGGPSNTRDACRREGYVGLATSAAGPAAVQTAEEKYCVSGRLRSAQSMIGR